MKRKKQFNYFCICGKKIKSDYKKHFKSYYHKKNCSHRLSNKIINHYKLKYYVMKQNNYFLPYDLWDIIVNYHIISNNEKKQKQIEINDKNKFFNQILLKKIQLTIKENLMKEYYI